MKDKLVQADLPLWCELLLAIVPRSPEQFLAADTAFALAALQLGSLESLAANLGTAGDWSGRTRVARAYRAGLSAREVLDRLSSVFAKA